MSQQLQNELKELAQTILNNTDVSVIHLKNQAQDLYERLTVLEYLGNKKTSNNDINTIPKELNKILPHSEKPIVNQTNNVTTQASVSDEIKTKPLESESPELLFELDALTASFDLPEFEPLSEPEQKPIVTKTEASLKSINTRFQSTITIGLNDRIAFVTQLFDNNQQDYTRVLSQLNTIETPEEAFQFIEQMVKPEYNNWEGKETFEERFLSIISRKFEI